MKAEGAGVLVALRHCSRVPHREALAGLFRRFPSRAVQGATVARRTQRTVTASVSGRAVGKR
jgi:hypothetical protein